MRYLLKLILRSEIEQGNIVGDLVEEYRQYQPKIRQAAEESG